MKGRELEMYLNTAFHRELELRGVENAIAYEVKVKGKRQAAILRDNVQVLELDYISDMGLWRKLCEAIDQKFWEKKPEKSFSLV